MKKNDPRIAIVGLGYVGLTLAVAFAKKSVLVAGIDLDLQKSQLIKCGKSPFYEEGFEKELHNVVTNESLKVLLELKELNEFEIDTWIITVGTPLLNSTFDLKNIKEAINSILDRLTDNSLIILRSTVGVGSTEEIDDWLRLQGLKVDLAMCPERTIEGDALNELRSLPQIIGANNSKALERATKLFKNLEIEILAARSTREAELAKLACNAFRDIQFAFANDIATLGELMQIDVNNSISIANLNYPRSKIPIPGPSAGPCLVKDSLILDSSFRKFGRNSLAKHARNINREVGDWPTRVIRQMEFDTRTKIKVAILGVAFKGRPSTNDIRDSMAIDIKKNLMENFDNMEIFGWDPIANTEDLLRYGFNWMDLELIIQNCDILILQNNHHIFVSKYFTNLISERNDIIILDLWNQLENKDLCHQIITYGGML